MIKQHLCILNQKKTLFLFLLLFGQFFVSCNRKNSQTEKNHFKVTIDLITHHNSSIQVFYKTIADDRYYEEYSIRKDIKESPTLQTLVFELPHGIKPKNIRIDLGENENENDSIFVKNISFQYKNNFINGDNGVYKSWFIFNPNVIEGKDSLTYILKRKKSLFDPQLNGNRKLNAKLVKLFPPDINEKN
jgi:hypothetical protein